MSSIRQDAWTQDEDLLLAEIVLRQIREGGTQLQAFEEVGKKLSRTSAACGFRWNSYVRKQYRAGIELAKKHRKEARNQINNSSAEQYDPPQIRNLENHSKPFTTTLAFESVIEYLKDLHNKAEFSSHFHSDREKSLEVIKDLEKKIFYLTAENERLTKDLKEIEADYRSLIEVMEKARKIFILQEEDRQQKVRFQMDKNGNLERVD